MARLVIISGVVVVAALAAALLIGGSDNSCPVSAIAGSGERIYLPTGTIYGWVDDPERRYQVVEEFTVHVTGDQLERMVCFESENEAQDAGYRSDNFSSGL